MSEEHEADEQGGELPTVPTQVEPLRIRPGTRYTCFGDGLCCSDMHAIGGLSEKEVQYIGAFAEEAVSYNEEADAWVLAMRPEDGTCVFLGREDQKCALHEPLGGALKPVACRRFPIAVVSTPMGGRVITEHRCPCRTMGDRPVLELAHIAPTITEEDGRVRPQLAIEHPVLLSREERAEFTRYVDEIETPFLEGLAATDDLAAFLDRPAFAPLDDFDWDKLGRGMKVNEGETRFDWALRWFGEAILTRDDPSGFVDFRRPWADAFDRAERRSPNEAAPVELYRDWISDHVWTLYWTAYSTWEQTRRELATRLFIAERITAHLRDELRLRPDRAAAEAVMIVDLIGTSEWWEATTHQIAHPE